MVSSPVSREAARAAKATLRECLRDESEVVGLGLTRRDGGYAVKVNLRSGPCAAVPAEVAGVPVVVEIVGLARAR